MDVVRNRIASLGGVVDLKSKPGVGSTVSIQLAADVGDRQCDDRSFPRISVGDTGDGRLRDLRALAVRDFRVPRARDDRRSWNVCCPCTAWMSCSLGMTYLPPPSKKHRDALVQAVLVRHGHRCLAIEVDDLDGNADIVDQIARRSLLARSRSRRRLRDGRRRSLSRTGHSKS